MVNVKKTLEGSAMNSIVLDIGISRNPLGGCTKFGGKPLVPKGFEWPYYEGEDYMFEETKRRPLSFFAQFDLSQISEFDTDGLLPPTGMLSFFYEYNTQRWGFAPKDKGCARVFLFDSELVQAEFPDDLPEEGRFPELGISAKSERSYQSYADFLVQRDPCHLQWEEFESVEKILGIKEPGARSKLLGWADPIQGNMTCECELVSRGYDLGGGWDNVKPQDRQEAEQWANRDWVLLFQLDSVLKGYELVLGDGGRIYFYIRRDDLKARNFDNMWLILQCG